MLRVLVAEERLGGSEVMLEGGRQGSRKPRSRPVQLRRALRLLADAAGISSQLCFPNVQLGSRHPPNRRSRSELMTSSPSPLSTPQPLQRRPVCRPDTGSASRPPPLLPAPIRSRPSLMTVPQIPAWSRTCQRPESRAWPPGPAPGPWRASETIVTPVLCHHHLPFRPALSVHRAS